MCELDCFSSNFLILGMVLLAFTGVLLLNWKKILCAKRVFNLSLVLIPLILYSVDLYARAGGGRSGKCGWACIILFPLFFIYAAYVNYRIYKKRDLVRKALKEMELREPQWSEENLVKIAWKKFMDLQNAWGEQNLVVIKEQLHPTLYNNWETQIKEQKARGEKNVMLGLSINEFRIVDVKNFNDDEQDEFTVCFDAEATDQTTTNGQMTKSEKSKFREFWTFEWEKSDWRLKEVVQSEGWRRFVSSAIIYERPVRK